MALKDYASGAFAQARGILGEQRLLSIGGGPSIEAIEAGARVERDYDELVHAPQQVIKVLVPAAAFKAAYSGTAESYLGNLCTLDGEKWRVGSFEEYGLFFVVIDLVSREEAA